MLYKTVEHDVNGVVGMANFPILSLVQFIHTQSALAVP